MSGPVLHLAEIVLWTRDMERSLAFYRDLFGLPLISPPELPNRFLRAGPGEGPVPEMIVLVPHPDPSGAFPTAKPQRPLHHLAFSVAPDRYEELQRRCREAGLEVRAGVHPVLEGVRTFYVDDPDGNEVECISSDPSASHPEPATTGIAELQGRRPEDWVEILEAGWNAVRGHDDAMARTLFAMLQKAREIAGRASKA